MEVGNGHSATVNRGRRTIVLKLTLEHLEEFNFIGVILLYLSVWLKDTSLGTCRAKSFCRKKCTPCIEDALFFVFFLGEACVKRVPVSFFCKICIKIAFCIEDALYSTAAHSTPNVTNLPVDSEYSSDCHELDIMFESYRDGTKPGG
jgi:hypothetical protein